MPGLKVRSTSGRSLQGQGFFRLFPPLFPLSRWRGHPPSPCHRPGLVDVVVFGFSPSHPGTSCAARCPIGAPLPRALPSLAFFAPTHHPKSEVRAESSMCFTLSPASLPPPHIRIHRHTERHLGVTWEPRPSHALGMVCGLGPANPLGFGLLGVLLHHSGRWPP